MDEFDMQAPDVLAEKRTDMSTQRTMMAAQRTIMSAERSLMVWIQTSLSMIAFGFSIYAFLQSLTEAGTNLAVGANGSWEIGLFLLALGTIAILFGSLEYLARVRKIRQAVDISLQRLPLIISGLIFFLGASLFVSILIKVRWI